MTFLSNMVMSPYSGVNAESAPHGVSNPFAAGQSAGASPAASNPFAAAPPAQESNPFGAAHPAQPAANNPFAALQGAGPTASNPFAAAQAPAAAANPFASAGGDDDDDGAPRAGATLNRRVSSMSIHVSELDQDAAAAQLLQMVQLSQLSGDESSSDESDTEDPTAHHRDPVASAGTSGMPCLDLVLLFVGGVFFFLLFPLFFPSLVAAPSHPGRPLRLRSFLFFLFFLCDLLLLAVCQLDDAPCIRLRRRERGEREGFFWGFLGGGGSFHRGTHPLFLLTPYPMLSHAPFSGTAAGSTSPMQRVQSGELPFQPREGGLTAADVGKRVEVTGPAGMAVSMFGSLRYVGPQVMVGLDGMEHVAANGTGADGIFSFLLFFWGGFFIAFCFLCPLSPHTTHAARWRVTQAKPPAILTANPDRMLSILDGMLTWRGRVPSYIPNDRAPM